MERFEQGLPCLGQTTDCRKSCSRCLQSHSAQRCRCETFQRRSEIGCRERDGRIRRVFTNSAYEGFASCSLHKCRQVSRHVPICLTSQVESIDSNIIVVVFFGRWTVQGFLRRSVRLLHPLICGVSIARIWVLVLFHRSIALLDEKIEHLPPSILVRCLQCDDVSHHVTADDKVV